MKNTNTKFIGGNGMIVAINADTGKSLWETELKSGWFKMGSSFVSLTEDSNFLYAFAYGKLYKIEKTNGRILLEGEETKKLKHASAVFSGIDNAQLSGAGVINESEKKNRDTDSHD